MIESRPEALGPRPFQATSISISVAELVDQARHGSILATFARSAYLDLEGHIVALVAEELLNGPLNVVLAGPTPPFDRLVPGGAAAAATGSLRLEGWPAISVQHAVRWDPRIRPWNAGQMPVVTSNLDILVGRVMGDAPSEPLDPPRIQQALRTLESALRAGSTTQMHTAAAALAGLGGGLTPTGDDILVGVLVALASLPAHESHDALCRAIERGAGGRTTRISAAYLQAAARREASEAWHRLLQAMSRSRPDDVAAAGRRILSVGETSGADMLTGFVLAMKSGYRLATGRPR